MEKFTVDFNHSGIISETDALKEIKRQVEKHNADVRQDVKDLLDLSIKTKTLVTLAVSRYRGCGKTTLLLEKALELGAVLIIPAHRLLPHMSESSVYAVRNRQAAVRGLRLKGNGFLVDEGVRPEIVRELIRNGNKFLGGFSSL